MKLFNTLVFDDTISTTTNTWYTPAEFHDRLGSADAFIFLASAANVTGTANLTVQAEHSADGQNWVNIGTGAEIPAADINANPVNMGYVSGVGVNAVPLAFVRLRVSLSGTNPQCRLKITATGRSY